MLCRLCSRDLPEDQFSLEKGRKARRSRCKACQRAYAKTHYAENKAVYADTRLKNQRKERSQRREWFLEFKAELKCARCPETHPACLDFHHLDPSTKDMAVSIAVTRWPKARVLQEIRKCVVLCANCHRKLHWEEKGAAAEITDL